eukprot:TRINITY_DN88092_c0_g1_i1.p1 TRINITY_DN88092_c0_g1~~TRINITY_DN88092_c0_g1_i1.p1  ORF type:complete len:370 (+),score=96.62 TRINITY_DN88092_c0_g1_i1:119-1228(+)
MAKNEKNESPEERENKLNQEIRALKLRLKETQDAKASLETKIVSVDRVRSELRAEQEKHSKTKDRVKALEDKVNEQAGIIKQIEAQVQIRDEQLTAANGRCLELESACALLGEQDGARKAELLIAREKQHLAQAAILDKTIALAEAESRELRVLDEIRTHEREAGTLRNAVQVLDAYAASAKEELFRHREEGAVSKARQDALELRCAKLQQSFEVQQGALQSSMFALGTLREKQAQLEESLEKKHTPALDALSPTGSAAAAGVCLALRPDRMELPLSTVVAQGCGSPRSLARSPRSAMVDRDLPKLAPHLQQDVARVSSRREYPRCAASKQLRGRILLSEHGQRFPDGFAAPYSLEQEVEAASRAVITK